MMVNRLSERNWLVSCFRLNGPLRQTVFQCISGRLSERGRKKRKVIDKRKLSKQSPPAPTASAIDPWPTIIQIARTLMNMHV